ncbi:ATP-binding protein [Streptomyces sp. NBC_00503]|uniref:ATP-binding protein n=1 Tax=Streptomyces sp. NBC_00503 TaxID=2903659 RepID=UPI002E821EE6|nr:ATP-binding protein [Streptomyces sp. NBC_00503]WUD83643.1 ATP-binding protein [Streptomyces sp. NBC_00503]
MDRSSTQGQTDPAERPARVVTLTAGDFTLTVNPVDGSEIEPTHRPGGEPARIPTKRAPAARASRAAAARPPVPPGAPAGPRPLFGREEERERLVRLLGRGRSVRLTGPCGSGRTALLDAVADACADLAPDGVVRLSAHGHQQPGELLHALYDTVYEASADRPERAELLARVRGIGAVVLLDDLDMGGPALDELLRATPECAYLLAATPDTRAPSEDSHLEEVFLGGLSHADCLALLEAGIGRTLIEAETAWAADLRFASEGLPLRFVQAAALLRRRDELNRSDSEDEHEEPGVFDERPREAAFVPLPTLAEGAAPAELLASRVSESARAALRIACALGGELPHHAHLPALVGDTHADTAVGELLACGLLSPVGTRYRLAAGVARQLEEAGYGDTAAEEARTAARHYAWWTGHTSVTPERVAAEADAVLAALAGADVVAAVLLARTAAPAFAASLHWEAWERVLRSGAEAARKAGEVAEQAYFHHELGVLALCEGRLDRARAELETSIGLRGALADKRGTVAGRRALALVTDRETAGVEVSPPLRLAPPVAGAAGAAGSAFGGPSGPGAVGAVGSAGPVGAAGVVRASGSSRSSGAQGAPVSAVSGVTPLSTVVLPVAADPAAAEAVTTVVPALAPAGSVSASTLAEVFEDAFPIAPEPEPVLPASGPKHESSRKKVLLAVAGALTVVALGTVVALAMSASDEAAPPAQGPGFSTAPTTGPAQSSPSDPGTSGNDPSPDPGASSSAPAAAVSEEPGATPSARKSPSRKPSATPRSSAPVDPPVTPSASQSSGSPSPSSSESPSGSPTTSPPASVTP